MWLYAYIYMYVYTYTHTSTQYTELIQPGMFFLEESTYI